MGRLRCGLWLLATFVLLFLNINPALAEEGGALFDLTRHPVGYLTLLIFFTAYAFVTVENAIHMRKSKPVMLAAGLIWALLGMVYAARGQRGARGGGKARHP